MCYCANIKDTDGFVGAVFGGDPNALEVRTEFTAGDPGDLGTDPLEAFGAPTGCHLIADLTAFSTNFTNPRHGSIPFELKGKCFSVKILSVNYRGVL